MTGSLAVNTDSPVVPWSSFLAGLMLLRPSVFGIKALPRGYSAEPLMAITLAMMWLVCVLGWFADDPGIIVPATALPLALPLGFAVLAGVPLWETIRPNAGRRSPGPPSPAGLASRATGGTGGTEGERVQYQLSRLIAGPFLHGLWRPQVIGAENIPATGGAILASNHLSVLDSVFLPLMLTRPVTFAAKSEYFTSKRPGLRLMGVYLKATGQLSVDRAGARAAQEMLEGALALLRSGELFGIYPEGTRSPDGRLYRARPGVGWLALNSGLPVIPVAMVGTDRVLPPGRVIPRLGRIEIRIGKPMTFGDIGGGEYGAPGKARRAIADEVIGAIQQLSGQDYVSMYATVRKEQLAAGA